MFAAIGYEPNCLPRHAARFELCERCDSDGKFGGQRCMHPDVDPELLPPMCGKCPQEVFHAATEFDVLYGGAAGGGKTYGLVAEGIKTCIRFPGIRVGLFRKSYPEIEDSIIPVLAEFAFAAALGATYDTVKHNLKFPNGSLLMLRFAENLQDASKRLGAEYQLLLFDEVTRTPPEVVAFLQSRLRSGRADIPVLGVRAASNPGGPGHGTVKEHYVEATDYGLKIIIDSRGRTVRFIPAKVSDNPNLNSEYLDDLNILDESTRAAYRDGSWDSFEGKVFTEFDRDRHIVPRVDLSPSWLRYGGMDYGWTAPSAYILAARDEDGRVWVYGELTMVQTPEQEQARRVLALEGELKPVIRSADTGMWGQQSSARPVALTFAEEGCPLRQADKDRLSGKARVHTYLGDGPACRYHRVVLGWDTCPRLHIIDGAAPELVRTLPNLNYDTKKTEDVDTTGDDHHYDALRYLLMGIGTTAKLVSVYDDGVEDFSLVNPIRPANEPIVDYADLHEQHGPIGAPQGAFAIGGEAPPTDTPWVGGVRSPFQ